MSALHGWRETALAAVIVVAAAAAAPFLAPAERRADAGRLMNELMSGNFPVGGPFTLSDPDAKQVSLAAFRGKFVLLYFGFATCPDVCPTDLAAIGLAVRSLEAKGEQIQPLFVTLDPQRDTPAALREYAAAFHPRFVALTGTEAEIRKVADDYKVFYEKVPLRGSNGYTIDHAAFTFLIDRGGKYIGLFPPGTDADRMAAILREHLRK